jgi:uncharacterized membrane protein affecting hemolysin expression
MQNPYAAQQQQWQQSAQKSVQKMIIIAVVGVLIALFLAGGAVAFLFMAR